MTAPTDDPHSSNIEQARHELWEGIEASREILRQSRLLIELSECDGAHPPDDEGCAAAN